MRTDTMQAISPLISRHRDSLKTEARYTRYVLVAALLAAIAAFSIFVSTLLGHYPLPVGEAIFAGNPERILGSSNFFIATAIGSALKMWRTRQLRIKLLIAEAFIRENDESTGLRLLLEPVFGQDVWRGTPAAQEG